MSIMKKKLALLSVLLCTLVIVSFKYPGHEENKKDKAAKPLCTLVMPSISVSYSGTYTIVTLTGGSADGFTVGGYYMDYFHDGTFGFCPVGGSIWFLTKSHGTFRVTAWCGSCQNATASIVSGPMTF
jgi:hypothetical protein